MELEATDTAHVSHDLAPATGGGGKASYVQLVPAVDQATRILIALARDPRGAATLTELCRASGVNKSKGLAILNTLRTAGMVSRNESSKTYRLGLTLLTLSRALLDHTDLTHEAAPYLGRVADATESAALLGVVSDDQLFIVARREPAAGVGITVNVGHRFPLTWGAHGKAILAALPHAERERMLARPPIYVYGQEKKGDVDLDALRRELDECRRLGFAHDLGVTRPGVRAVSAVLVPPHAPAEPDDEQPARVAGCLIAVGTFSSDLAHTYGSIVAATARQMSDRLGSLL